MFPDKLTVTPTATPLLPAGAHNDSTQATRDGRLAATPAPLARVNGWLNQLQRAPQGRPVQPGAMPTVRSPARFIPQALPGSGQASRGSALLQQVFDPGSRMRAATGLQQLSRPLSNDLVASVIAPALTEQRMAQFERLPPAQKEVARALLSAAMAELQLPPWEGGAAAARGFDDTVGLILDVAASWRDRNAQTPQASQPSQQAPSTTPSLPDPVTALPEPVGTLPDPAAPARLPEGYLEKFTSQTKHGALTTEVYRSSSIAESKLGANVDVLQQKNPLLYAGLPKSELLARARSSDVTLVTTQGGTSDLWGRDAPSSTTPARAITSAKVRDFAPGEFGLPQGGRLAELTFVASNELRGAGGEVVSQAEAWARRQPGVQGVTFYNTDTTGGSSRGFYERMGYSMTRQTEVEVKSLDPRVQQQLLADGRFTPEQVASGEAKLPRYYFVKQFDAEASNKSLGDKVPKASVGEPTATSGQPLDSSTVAQNLVPLRPSQRVGNWQRALTLPQVTTPGGAPLRTGAQPIRTPTQIVPIRPADQRNPLARVFGADSRTQTAPGVPQGNGRIDAAALPVVESALNDNRLARFDRLSPPQQEQARGMLLAAIDGLQQPPWSPDRISPAEFGQVVDLLLDSASRQPQAAATPNPVPTLPDPVTAATLPEAASPSTLPSAPRAGNLPMPVVAQSGSTPQTAATSPLAARLQNVTDVRSLEQTSTGAPGGARFSIGDLTTDEIRTLNNLLGSDDKARLLDPSRPKTLEERFLYQTLADQADPSKADPVAQQKSRAALAEIAAPAAGEDAAVKVGFRYVQDKPAGAVSREAVYTKVGRQMEASPNGLSVPPEYSGSSPQQARMWGDTVLREFNNALKSELKPYQDPVQAEVQVLQNPEGETGQTVRTDAGGLADRLTGLINTAAPKLQGVNRVLNVVNPVILAVGAGKTVYDFAKGGVIPRFNDDQAARLFNVPKGMFVASVTLRSKVAGVPTAVTAYIALGAKRDVALLPGQPGGQMRLQIGKNPLNGKSTVGVLSTAGRSLFEGGVGVNVGGNNLAVRTTQSVRVASVGGNPLRGQINLPESGDGAASARLSASGGAALSYTGVQYTKLTGNVLGPVVYARREVKPIELMLQATAGEQVTRGVGNNVSWGGFSLAKLPKGTGSDSFVLTVNPAFDASGIQQIIDVIDRAGDVAQREGVLQQLERMGAIVRTPAP